jgi:putative glutamine amidotransferase
VPAFPLVAVTATIKLDRGAKRVRLNDAYLRAIEDARLTPIVTAPLTNLDRCGDVLDTVRGLVLTGGEDVDPAEYGAEPHPALGEINPHRDRWEIALAREARARRIPTLAICRGLQVVNVALGGTLVQDIPAQWPGGLQHEGGDRGARSHSVEVVRGSRTEEALGESRVSVNSAHHQAIETIAAGLRITARSPDGIVEAAESEDGAWWMVGVQWHPEELTCTAEPWDRGLFSAFADRCRR